MPNVLGGRRGGGLGGSGRRQCLVAAVPSIMGFGGVGGRCVRRRPYGARCCVLRLTVCRSQCRGGVELSTQIRPLGSSKRNAPPTPSKKKISGVPADNGPASRLGRAPTTNSPPPQSVKALGPMASHDLHVSSQGQGRPGAGCGTTQCESGLGCDNDAGVGGPSTLPVCRPSIVVVAQEIVDSNELPTASTGQEHTI